MTSDRNAIEHAEEGAGTGNAHEHGASIAPTVRRRSLRSHKILRVLPWLATVVVILPIVVVAAHLTMQPSEIAQQMMAIVLPRYLATTLMLAVGVALVSLVIGVVPAWLVVMCRFPGRRFFEWALVLPLAMPAYVLAYVYYEMMASSGPIQGVIQHVTGLGPRDYWFPQISTLGGAIFILSVALYPYVYLSARAAFIQQAGSIFEVSRTLGSNAWVSFLRVMLPLARPALVVGLTLVVMETMADFGAVSMLGVQTFTTGIYRAWFSIGDRVAASQLAAMLLFFVMFVVWLERTSRKSASYHNDEAYGSGLPPIRPKGWKQALAFAVCALPFLFGFALPMMRLIYLASGQFGAGGLGWLFEIAANSVSLALVTALIAMVAAIFIVYANRVHKSRRLKAATSIACLGYAIPGPIIAVGTLLPFAWFDNVVNGWAQALFGVSTGLLLTGSWVALIFGYLARFMVITIGNVEAGFAKTKHSLDDAASALGAGVFERLWHVHIPLLWAPIGAGTLVMLVDVMKELPMSMVLRPFNFDTLAITIYDFARDERLAEAALPALVLVSIGLFPVYLISRQMRRGFSKDISKK